MYGIVKFKLKDAMARYITRQVMSYGELKLVRRYSISKPTKDGKDWTRLRGNKNDEIEICFRLICFKCAVKDVVLLKY